MKHIKSQKLLKELQPILEQSVGRDYAYYISTDDEFFAAVKENVETASAWQYEGYYTEDDIRLAIGRVIMKKFDINC